MTPDTLLRELAILIEETVQPMYSRETGLQEPMSRAEWIAFKDKVDLLCAAYTPREEEKWNPSNLSL